MKFFQANRIAPDGTPHSAASHLGLCCLPMSHKRDARLKGVKLQISMMLSEESAVVSFSQKKTFMSLGQTTLQYQSIRQL